MNSWVIVFTLIKRNNGWWSLTSTWLLVSYVILEPFNPNSLSSLICLSWISSALLAAPLTLWPCPTPGLLHVLPGMLFPQVSDQSHWADIVVFCLLFIYYYLPVGEGNGNPLQYSCLENSMDRGAWQATVHGVPRVGHNLVTKPPSTCYLLPIPTIRM